MQRQGEVLMADILHAVTIAAPPAKVYAALTEETGLRSWWTQHATAEAKADTVATFGFYGGQFVFKLHIDELNPPRKVAWGVQQGAPGWDHTQITWDLAEDNGKTNVLLGHRGWASTEGNYASTSYNWAWYLTSLKQYLETGTGTPHTDADMH
jgi:uncharacterized protein YndB with AHSA1/START domain